ncbi:MAG: type II toxin-antitoxin system RatA family toxin [Granulosicoccaceae bacterium]
MSSISRSALVGFTAAQMYQLVLDVESYPKFLPWCSGSEVTEQSVVRQLASVSIKKAYQQTKFTTQNALEQDQRISMSLQDGPFKNLDGVWHFIALSDSACKVELDIEFQFRSSLVEKMIGPAFSTVTQTIVNAFVKRAGDVYGM